MPDTPAGKIVSGVTGPIGDIVGGIGQMHESEWMKAAFISMLQYLQSGGQYGLDRYQEAWNPIRDFMLQNLGPSQSYLWGGEGLGPGQLPTFGGEMGDWRSGLLGLASNLGQWQTPETQQAIGGLFGGAQGAQPTMDLAAQLFAGGGWSQPGQNIMDAAMGMGQGQGWEMGQMATTGGGLLGPFGANRTSLGLTDRMFDVLGASGRTPQLDALSQAGLATLGGLFGVGGLTPTGAAGEGVGLQGLLQGGQTPLTNYLQQAGGTQAGEEPLLPMDMVLSFAKSEAARQVASQAEAAKRQIYARGGGPAALAQGGMGGNQAGGLVDFTDAAIQSESQAIRDALMKQQGLQLQRQQQGTQMALGASDAERQRLATYAQMLSGLEDVAARRYGLGINLAGQAEQIAAGREQAYGNLGLGAGQLENARMQTGGSLLDQYNQLRLGGLGLAQTDLANMAQRGIQGGQLYNALLGTQGGLYNDALSQLLGQGQLGNQRFGTIAGAMNTGFGQQNDFLKTIMGGMTGTYSPFVSGTTAPLDIFGRAMSTMPGIWSPFATYQLGAPSGGSQLVKGIGGVAGTIAGNLPGGGGRDPSSGE